MKNFIMNFMKEEEGMGTVEILVIIAVLVGIALIFKDSIRAFVTNITKKLFGDGTSDEISVR